MVNRLLPGELARRAPLLPGKDTLVFIDIDAMLKRVYGLQKQGAPRSGTPRSRARACWSGNDRKVGCVKRGLIARGGLPPSGLREFLPVQELPDPPGPGLADFPDLAHGGPVRGRSPRPPCSRVGNKKLLGVWHVTPPEADPAPGGAPPAEAEVRPGRARGP